jgi:hypothetical protein
MSIVLVGSSSGSITLQEPAVAGTTVLDLPATSGTVVVTGTTPTLNGITFPATQVPSADANTLDDYEEGTWTPTVFIAGATGITYSRRVGLYTKIGNTVTCEMTIDLSNKGTGAGAGTAVEILGLPFTHNNTSNGYPNFFIATAILGASSIQTSGQIGFGSSTITPIKNTGSTSADSQMVNSDITNTSQFRALFTYLV